MMCHFTDRTMLDLICVCNFSHLTVITINLTIRQGSLFNIGSWIRHLFREREVEGSIPSVGDIGVRSDMAGW